MNIFAAAKEMQQPKPAKRGKGEPAVEIAGVKKLAAVSLAIKAFQALYAVVDAEVKATGMNRFIAKGIETKTAPESFDACEGEGYKANIQLKRKSSASAIPEEERALCAANNITVVKRVSRPACYVFNPAYTNDQKVLTALSKALEKMIEKGTLPDDIIMQQSEESVWVVGDNCIAEVFASGDAAKAAALLPVVTTMATRPTVAQEEIPAAMKYAIDLMGEAQDALKASAAEKKAA